MSSCQELSINNPVGLHARPAALFVKKAMSYKCKIAVQNLTKQTQQVNAKSLLSLLSIAVLQGDRILIAADGDDERDALAGLVDLVESTINE